MKRHRYPVLCPCCKGDGRRLVVDGPYEFVLLVVCMACRGTGALDYVTE